MKFKKVIRLTLLTVVLLMVLAPAPVMALQTDPPASDVGSIAQVAIAAFIALEFWPALLAVILTALQYFGVSAETAERINFWANLVLFGGIFFLVATGQIDLVGKLDSIFGNAAQLLTYLLVLIGVPLGFIKTQEKRATVLSTSLIGSRFR